MFMLGKRLRMANKGICLIPKIICFASPLKKTPAEPKDNHAEFITGRNEVTTSFFYVWPLWCACSFSGITNGLIVMAPSCVTFLYPSAEESWEEMTNIEPKNKILYSPGSDQSPGRPVVLVADSQVLWPSLPATPDRVSPKIGVSHGVSAEVAPGPSFTDRALKKYPSRGRGHTHKEGCVCVIFEEHGCPNPCAITFLHHILRRRVAKLEQGSHLKHGVAWMIAARELFASISCILLVMHHQMFQTCFPIAQAPDQPREMTATGSSLASSQPGFQGDPWPDAEPWQGQASQLILTSTQGAEPFSLNECMRPWC